MSKLTVVMYHYVRDLNHSRYPDIKGLQTENFKGQLKYIVNYYNVIRMEDLIYAVSGDKVLPDNSLLLTFDDGFKEHFDIVFPILDELGIQGSFFPPAKAILEHQILDVHKIHFILASVKDKQQLVKDIFDLLDHYRNEYNLDTSAHYYTKYAVASRFDSEDVFFIKCILQKGIAEKLREIITDILFKKYVYNDMSSFAKELYMDIDQLRCMRRKGMFIGSHSYSHNWLNTLEPSMQRKELDLSIEFLKLLGCSEHEFVMCYPYGAYNDSLIALLKEKNCHVGLCTKVGIADLSVDQPLALPRLDTNDLPVDHTAQPNSWTNQIIAIG